jgi:hypothetical protein
MTDCPFWLRVAEKMRETDADFELGDFRTGFDLGPKGAAGQLRSGSLHWNFVEQTRDRVLRSVWASHEREMQEVGARTVALAETVMAITDSHVFLDASKERLRARYLTRYVAMEVRVVHLVRDPRGVVDSALRRHADEGETAERVARRWVSAQRAIERVLGELPAERWMRLRYEALCADVEGTLRQLFVFCGVDPDKTLAEPPEQHLLGNKMRLQGHHEIRLDERWRSSLSSDRQQLVLDIAGPTMERLGLGRGAPVAALGDGRPA